MINNNLFYLSNSQYGGWVSFSFHLAKILQKDHVIKIKNTFKGGSTFYGDIKYKNVKPQVIEQFNNPIILAVDKAHTEYLKYFRNATIVIHDPTELSKEVIEFCKANNVITIRETVNLYLNNLGIKNTYLKHPFFKYQRYNLPKIIDRSLSRVDFDKNTDIICKANNIGSNIEIYGYKNHLYYFHKLKELNFDDYYKGYYGKELKEISKLYAETKFLVDLSTIKNDGGGTQYTFLEAEYHNCALILHNKWCDVPNSIFTNNQNCYSVSDEYELKEALTMKPLFSGIIPTDEENKLWKILIK
jgi:hypothetical protein